MAGKTKLMDIPEEVMEKSLFPYLHARDLLRFSNLNVEMRARVFNYFRVHPRPFTQLQLDVPTSEEVPLSLQRFIEGDSRMGERRHPSSSFRLVYDEMTNPVRPNLEHPDFLRIIIKYQDHIQHLELDVIKFPFTEQTRQLLENMSKLRLLKINRVVANSGHQHVSHLPREEQIRLPGTFGNIKKLDIRHWRQNRADESPLLSRLLGACSELQEFVDPYPDNLPLLGTLEILTSGNLRNIKFVDLGNYILVPVTFREEDQPDRGQRLYYRRLFMATQAANIKLRNVHQTVLTHFQLNFGSIMKNLTPLVHSISALESCTDFNGRFYNLEKVNVSSDDHFGEDYERRFLRFLAEDRCPYLTCLDITCYLKDTLLCQIWQGVEKLKELHLFNPGDITFLGDNPLDVPPFIKLRKLEKLTVVQATTHSIEQQETEAWTDAVFLQVLKDMPLRELHIQDVDLPPRSRDSPRLVRITSSGIRSLLQGRFKRTIQIFPFTGWRVRDHHPVRFEELGKEFMRDRISF